MRISDWSSDCCSSDLCHQQVVAGVAAAPVVAARRAAQAVAVVVVDHVGAAVAGPVIAMAAAPARRTPVHEHRPRRVVPRTAMDHPRPANHDSPVVETVAAVLAAVEIGSAAGGEGGCQYM